MPRKKDLYSSAGQKVVGLYSLLLFTGRAYSLGQLAKLFHCSKQTVLRMVEEIALSQRMDLESWMEGRERMYRARTPQQRPNVSLSIDEIQHLLLCRDMVWHWLPAALREDVEQTIAKATVLLPEYDHRDAALTSLAGARPKGVVDYSNSQDQVDAVLRAVRDRLVCEIDYQSPERPEAKTLIVAPYQVLAYREGLYVRARLEKALEAPADFYDPTLALHRMKEVRLTDRPFAPIPIPEDMNGAAHGFGLFHGTPFRVVVEVVPKAAMYVRERIWSQDQELTELPDGGLRLAFTANSRLEVMNWVLSFGGEATLIEPTDLRAELRERINRLLVQHTG